MLTQAPGQTVGWSGGQTHLLSLQISPGEQAMPQPPQFCESVLGLLHEPLQQWANPGAQHSVASGPRHVIEPEQVQVPFVQMEESRQV